MESLCSLGLDSARIALKQRIWDIDLPMHLEQAVNSDHWNTKVLKPGEDATFKECTIFCVSMCVCVKSQVNISFLPLKKKKVLVLQEIIFSKKAFSKTEIKTISFG